MRCEEGGGKQVVTPGSYHLTIDAAEEGLSKAGKQVLKLYCHIVDGGFQDTTIDMSLPPWKAAILAKAVGADRQQGPTGKAYYEISPVELIGVVVSVTIDNRDFNGSSQNDVQNDFALVSKPDSPF